jgi:2-polyprenyl-3-methyl-5-hydroxy-6-metoxy-1,4-benzoquinol methylase
MTYHEKMNEIGYYEAEPKPSAADLAKHYAEKYFQEAQGTYAPEYRDEELRHFRNIAKVADFTTNQLKVEKQLLDLGCGEGFFGKYFFNIQWDITCCDYSEFGIAKHNSDLLPYFIGGDIYETLKQYQKSDKRFGLINLQNVLEHVLDPISILNDLRPLLAKRGLLRIRVPNDYSNFQLALMKQGHTHNSWFNPPEHISYFNKTSLCNILAECGYRVQSLQADFPIEIFLANPHSNYWKDRNLGKNAHLTRVFCENHLIESDIENYVKYSEAAGALGFGRELIAYARAI